MITERPTHGLRLAAKQVLKVKRPVERTWGLFETEKAIEDDTERWTRLLDETLLQWGLDPTALDDDGVTAPSKDTIRDAYNIGCIFRESGFLPPTHVVAGPDGEITFEFAVDESTLATCEIRDDGTNEFCLITDGRVERIEFGNGSGA